MKIAIANLGQIVSGDWRNPFVAGDTIVTDGDRLAAVGAVAVKDIESADVVIDAGGMTAIPGLINSHVHITFGDYTPRQRTVGYLESYLHGGTTTAISASEVHVPGRPSDPEGVKALAVAAQRCFASYRPGGMKVIAGSVILEPGLTAADFTELAGKGVKLAKAGFGAVKTAYDYVPLVRDAKNAGLITTCHTGGSSIPGSGAIAGEIALQVCTAGNLRTVLLCARLADELGVSVAMMKRSKAPTGSGVMPLGMAFLDHPLEVGVRHRRRPAVDVKRHGGRHRADRRARRRHTKDRPCRDQAWRYRRDRRGSDRRRATLRRPQPQYPRH